MLFKSGGVGLGVRLRPYQNEAVDTVMNRMAAGARRQLVALPTGSGKTIVAAELARRLGGRTLFLVHRDELAQQAIEKLALVRPGVRIGLVKAKSDETDASMVVASVQTLARQVRLDRLVASGDFRLVVVDEAHRSVASSWSRVLTGLGVLPECPEGTLLLGLSATPFRADGVGLDKTFQEISFRLSILNLIRQGYLCDVVAYRLETRLDLSKVRTLAGDFNEKDLALAVNTPKRNQVIVRGYQKYVDGRKAVVFAVDVQHAKDVSAAFNEAGIPADVIHGEMAEGDRRRVLERLRTGEITVLANCLILSEGWDEPTVESIIMARPTKSTGLYIQAVGRGLRPFPGKANCVVLDLADIRHDLCHVGSLFGRPLSWVREGSALSEVPLVIQRKTQTAPDLRPGVGVVAKAMDILGRSTFVWQSLKDVLILQASPTQKIFLVPTKANKYRVTLRESGVAEKVLAEELPLGYAQGVAEDFVRERRLESFAAKDAPWRGKPASAAQRALIRGFGLAVPDDLTQEAASEMISRYSAEHHLKDANALWRLEPATAKQMAWLHKHKCHPRAGLTRGEAADKMNRFFELTKQRASKKQMKEAHGA